MAWTAPRTFVTGEIVTAAILNTHVRDNLLYLKGTNQVPTISTGLIIDDTDGDEYLRLPRHTTNESTSVLTASTNLGKIVFDSGTDRIKYRDSATIRSLLNVSDVQDTPSDGASTSAISSNWAYDFTHIATSAGDMLYASAAGAFTRVGIGTEGQYLQVSSVSTPIWANSAAFNTKMLSFTRSLSAATAAVIYGGFGFTPKSLTITYHTDINGGVGIGGASAEESTFYTLLSSPYGFGNNSYIIYAGASGAGQAAALQTVSVGGFTLDWTYNVASRAGSVCSFTVLAIG